MPLNEMSMETFDKIMEVNLRSVVLMIKAVLPIMIQNKCGNICSIASGAALRDCRAAPLIPPLRQRCSA